MGGYFICNGIERIIRMITLQRRHYIMALRRNAYRKRGANYTDAAVAIRSGVSVSPYKSTSSISCGIKANCIGDYVNASATYGVRRTNLPGKVHSGTCCNKSKEAGVNYEMRSICQKTH